MSIIARLLNQRLKKVEQEIDRLEHEANALQLQKDDIYKQLRPWFNERDELNAALLESTTHAQQEL